MRTALLSLVLAVPGSAAGPSLPRPGPGQLPEILPAAPLLSWQGLAPTITAAAGAPLRLAAGGLTRLAELWTPPAALPAPPETFAGPSRTLFDGSAPARLVGRDDTETLRRILHEVRQGRAGPLGLRPRQYQYLLAPGLRWNALPDYFGPNLRRLRSLGLEASLVETNPVGTTVENGVTFSRAVARADGPVVILAHSKGTNDARAALRLRPELQRRISRLVALQSPVQGSAVARWLLSHPRLLGPTAAVSALLNPWSWLTGGNLDPLVLEDLSRDGHAPGPWGPELKVFSVASRVGPGTWAPPLSQLMTATVRTLTGQDNDGVVTAPEAVWPGSTYALLEHASHADVVADPSSWQYRAVGARGHDPGFAADFTEAVVRWIFRSRALSPAP